MKNLTIFCFLSLTPLCQGCITFANTARTLVLQPAHFADELDRVLTHCLHVRMGKEALATNQALHTGEACSRDFADGFVDGYARYLDKGGDGNPPPLPPRRYWRVHCRTPEGKQVVEEYFAGFRAGSAAAIASGFRSVDTVATSLPPRPPRAASAGWATAEAEPSALPSDESALPVPRQVSPRQTPDGGNR